MDITKLNSKGIFTELAHAELEIHRIKTKVKSSDFIQKNSVFERSDTFTKMDGTKIRIVIYTRNGNVTII